MSDFVPIHGLHHYAYRCRGAEETRRFYEDILGLPLVHIIRAEDVPSPGEHCPYVHLFFEMRDGWCIAFIDPGDGQAAEPSRNTPEWCNHIAFRGESLAHLEKAKQKPEAAGVSVLGPTDHEFVKSIYFIDPNGLRLELTTFAGTAQYMAEKRCSARAECDAWSREKEQRRRAGGQPKRSGATSRANATPTT